MKIALITLIALTFLSCEKFETSANSDTFYHVSSAGFELPVWIKGNTTSNKFVVFINGGPGLTSIDIASANILGWGESLEKEFAMVYYDQRGTGNAQGLIPGESITIEQYQNDLEAIIYSILHHYPSAKIFLMGHSFGGFIGQSFLLDSDRQALIQGWININGSTIADSDKEWQFRLQFLEELAEEKMSEDSEKWSKALEWIENNDPITTMQQKEEWRGFIGHAGDGVIPEENTNLTGKGLLSIVFSSSYNIFPAYLSSNGTKVGELLFENIKGTDLLPELYNIKLPSLILWGKYDDIIPPQLGSTAFDAMGTNFDEKEFVLFEKSGHQPFLNEIELFESTVIKFVNEH